MLCAVLIGLSRYRYLVKKKRPALSGSASMGQLVCMEWLSGMAGVREVTGNAALPEVCGVSFPREKTVGILIRKSLPFTREDEQHLMKMQAERSEPHSNAVL